MIKHIVMFKLKEELSNKEKEESIQKAITLASSFQNKISSIISCNVVINSKLAPESNYEIALICVFNDIEGLNYYQSHPLHLDFGEFITSVRESRACIDFEYD